MNNPHYDLYARSVLRPGKAIIRVLHLKPGQVEDELEANFSLLEIYDDPPPTYECVSYVWGKPIFNHPAVINERRIGITKNLYDALHHIRSKSKTVVVWADAICINQADNDEKSNQVAMMADIYRLCSKVHIWLGLPLPGSLSGDPFRFLYHFLEGKHFYEFPGFDRDEATGQWTWKENEECDHILDDFLQIVKSPWWTRAWTVQECLLPKETKVMFGTWNVTWAQIIEADYKKNAHGDGAQQCCVQANKVFNPYQLDKINEWMWHPVWAESFRNVVHGNGPPPWFSKALLTFASRQCENPRDKIYSLLSLAQDSIYQDLKPDYGETVPNIYIDIFTRMFQETNGDFTCFMGGGFGSPMEGLPSWVRDLSQTRAAGIIAGEERRIRYVSLYQASRLSPVSVHWKDNREMRHRGTYVDRVKVVGPCMWSSRTLEQKLDISEVFHQWLDLCRAVVGDDDPEGFRHTFSRIICGDVCKTVEGGAEFRRARSTDFPEEHIWNQMIEGNLYATDMRGYGWGLNFAMWGRCLFTTHEGRLGLCHPNTKSGDEIWIMRGVQVPFVVRALEQTKPGGADSYSLIGDCFLQGTMDGEVAELEKLMERPIVFV